MEKEKRFAKVKKIGSGIFGDIYEGIKGQDAIDFLLIEKSGEVADALFHSEIGTIDLIWGRGGIKGYGLAHIVERHSHVVSHLAAIIEESFVYEKILDRVILMRKDGKYKSVVDLEFNQIRKKWLVTTYAFYT